MLPMGDLITRTVTESKIQNNIDKVLFRKLFLPFVDRVHWILRYSRVEFDRNMLYSLDRKLELRALGTTPSDTTDDTYLNTKTVIILQYCETKHHSVLTGHLHPKR